MVAQPLRVLPVSWSAGPLLASDMSAPLLCEVAFAILSGWCGFLDSPERAWIISEGARK